MKKLLTGQESSDDVTNGIKEEEPVDDEGLDEHNHGSRNNSKEGDDIENSHALENNISHAGDFGSDTHFEG